MAQVVVRLEYAGENGTRHADTVGPWDMGDDGEQHLQPVHDFMAAALKARGVTLDGTAELAIVLDPAGWLAAHQR